VKILLASNSIGNLYAQRYELVEEVLKQGHSVVICSSEYESDDKVNIFQNMGCSYHQVNMVRRGKGIIQDISTCLGFYKAIKNYNPDIVFSYTVKPNIYAGIACRVLGIDFVPNVTGLGSILGGKGLLSRIVVILTRISFKRAKTVFIQNDRDYQFLQQRAVLNNNVTRIPGSGVNITKFNPNKNIDSKHKIFLFVSRVMREKGIDELLSVAKSMREQRTDIEFWVVGSCEEKYEGILSDYSERGIIKYFGFSNDMLDFYYKCTCLVHPSFYNEGISNVILEAQACGKPVLTTNVPGCSDIIYNGVNGFTFEPKNTNSLMSTVNKFLDLSDEAQHKMGMNGRKRVVASFNRETVINEYMKFL